jgi:hypothetical protein
VIALYVVGLMITAAVIAGALIVAWRRPRRQRPMFGRCEVCACIGAELKLTPYRDSCRWVCRGCYLALNDDGSGP